jgi:protease-4
MSRSTLFVSALLVLAGCSDPEPDVSGGFGRREARELVLSGAPAEGGPAGLLGGGGPTMRDVGTQLHAIATTDSARGVFLRIEPLGGAWGRAGDLADAIAEVHEAGKPVHCHFERADNASFYLMSQACDRIAITPSGTLNLVGPAAQVFYARDLLSNVGVEAQIVAVGRYKSAGDVATRSEMPETTREALGAILDDYAAALSSAIGRRVQGHGDDAADAAATQARIDAGPYDARRALEAGLVDAIEYDDQARERLRVAADAPRVRRVPMPPREPKAGLLDLLEALSGDTPEAPEPGPHLAIVVVSGTIVDGDRMAPGQSVSTPFVEHMRALARDEDVRAVVLRVDSPGGSALASDRMWHAVRRVAAHKPVIVSVGDMAASGGYYIAAAGTEILAHETSLVGSIGVLGGKVSFGELARRVGVHPVVLERGANSAWWSPLRAFTESEEASVRRMLGAAYRLFVGRVATSREMPYARVAAAAEGRVYTGRAGLELGLVDRIGGIRQAIDRARAAGHLGADAPIRVWPERGSMLETLSQAVGGGSARAAVTRLEGAALPPPLDYALTLADLLAEADRPLAATPFLVEIR